MSGTNRRWSGWMVLGLCGVLGGSAVANGQDGYPIRPSAEHKLLAKDVGVWDATIQSYMQGPDAEPLTSKGVETNTLMGDGLWLISSFEGDLGGQPFEGRSVTGYDPEKQKYIGAWVDSMSPTLMLVEGTYDEASKTLTMLSEGKDPISGATFECKMTATYDSDDERTFQMFMAMPDTGDEFVKAMEIQYRRRPE